MRKKVGEREVKEDYNRKALNWKIMSGKNTLFMPDNLGSNLGCGSFVTPNSSLPLHFHLQLATPFNHPSFSISPNIRISLLFLAIPALYLDNQFSWSRTPALSPCPASTSQTTTAMRRFTLGVFPFPRPQVPVQQLWAVSTIRVLWYGPKRCEEIPTSCDPGADSNRHYRLQQIPELPAVP